MIVKRNEGINKCFPSSQVNQLLNFWYISVTKTVAPWRPGNLLECSTSFNTLTLTTESLYPLGVMQHINIDDYRDIRKLNIDMKLIEHIWQ